VALRWHFGGSQGPKVPPVGHPSATPEPTNSGTRSYLFACSFLPDRFKSGITKALNAEKGNPQEQILHLGKRSKPQHVPRNNVKAEEGDGRKETEGRRSEVRHCTCHFEARTLHLKCGKKPEVPEDHGAPKSLRLQPPTERD
jgi:hypothetical protein